MNPLSSAGRRLLPALLVCLAACTAPPPVPEPAMAVPPAPQAPPMPPPPCPAEPPPAAAGGPTLPALLAYQQALRTMGPADLARELTALNAQPSSPAVTLRKALLLSLGRSSGDVAVAQALLDSVATATVTATVTAPPEPLQPLAGLLSARLAEQRRLMETVDRLGQQLRDSQRRNEQLAEKLEALKAIEQRLPASPVMPSTGASGAANRQP